MEQWLEVPSRPPLTPPGLSLSPTPPRPRSSLSLRCSIGHLTPLDSCKRRQQYFSFGGSPPLSTKSLRYSLRAPAITNHQQLSPQPILLLPVLPIHTVLPAPQPRSLLHEHNKVIASHVRVFPSSDTHLSAPVAFSDKPHDHGRITLPIISIKSPAGIQSSIGNRPASLDSILQGMCNSRPLSSLQHSQVKALIPSYATRVQHQPRQLSGLDKSSKAVGSLVTLSS